MPVRFWLVCFLLFLSSFVVNWRGSCCAAGSEEAIRAKLDSFLQKADSRGAAIFVDGLIKSQPIPFSYQMSLVLASNLSLIDLNAANERYGSIVEYCTEQLQKSSSPEVAQLYVKSLQGRLNNCRTMAEASLSLQEIGKAIELTNSLSGFPRPVKAVLSTDYCRVLVKLGRGSESENLLTLAVMEALDRAKVGMDAESCMEFTSCLTAFRSLFPEGREEFIAKMRGAAEGQIESVFQKSKSIDAFSVVQALQCAWALDEARESPDTAFDRLKRIDTKLRELEKSLSDASKGKLEIVSRETREATVECEALRSSQSMVGQPFQTFESVGTLNMDRFDLKQHAGKFVVLSFESLLTSSAYSWARQLEGLEVDWEEDLVVISVLETAGFVWDERLGGPISKIGASVDEVLNLYRKLADGFRIRRGIVVVSEGKGAFSQAGACQTPHIVIIGPDGIVCYSRSCKEKKDLDALNRKLKVLVSPGPKQP